MNRGQLVTALSSRLGIPTAGDGLLTTASMQDMVQSAARDLASEADWPWLLTSGSLTFSTTTGLATAPTGMVKARELTIGGIRACYVALGEFLDAVHVDAYVWTIRGTSVALSVIPATAPTAVLWYISGETSFTADADSPLAPDVHHNVLLARASYHANTRRSRFEDAIRDDNEYQLGVRKMRDAQWVKTGPRSVRAAGSTRWATW